MRKVFLIFYFCFFSTLTNAQNSKTDSLIKVLQTAKEDSLKVNILTRLGQIHVWNNPKKAIEYALPALALAQKLGYKKGQLNAALSMGEALAMNGNYEKAMELKFKGLKIAEEIGDRELIGSCLLNVAAGYFYHGDYQQTINYTKRGMQIPEFFNKNKFNQERANGFLGEAYFHLGKLDSALYHIQRAYEIDVEINRSWAVPYFYLGHIHLERKNFGLALEYYNLGLRGKVPIKDSIEGQIGIANTYHQMGKSDSALFYARQAINTGKQFGFMAEVLDAAVIAKNVFKKSGTKDSVYFYQELISDAKDSLYSHEKVKALQNVTFNEQLRQQEQEVKKFQELQERKRNLQYLVIALAIITFLVLFFILSHSIIANQSLIKYLGILALLIVFEFINLFIHPYIDKLTNHSIPLMLGIMVCIAALLIPLHHKLEHWITHKLVEKNKKIRLAAAKKTIASLEKQQ